MSNCVVCGHSVVAWCPDDSNGPDDLVCYLCGTHANGTAAKAAAALRAQLSEARQQSEAEALAYSALSAEHDRLRQQLSEAQSEAHTWQMQAERTLTEREALQARLAMASNLAESLRALKSNPNSSLYHNVAAQTLAEYDATPVSPAAQVAPARPSGSPKVLRQAGWFQCRPDGTVGMWCPDNPRQPLPNGWTQHAALIGSPWDACSLEPYVVQPAQAAQGVADVAFHVPTLESVLRGLKSEDDSTQLRAIISEVEAMLAAARVSPAAQVAQVAQKEYHAVAQRLYQLLDDIDTAGDVAKSDDKLYRSIVERTQAKKGDLVVSCDGYAVVLVDDSMLAAAQQQKEGE